MIVAHERNLFHILQLRLVVYENLVVLEADFGPKSANSTRNSTRILIHSPTYFFHTISDTPLWLWFNPTQADWLCSADAT